ALGIGADGQWDAFMEAEPFKSAVTNLDKPGGMSRAAWRDIVWRSRGKQTPALLAEILRDPSTPTAELPRFMRAFDYLQGPEKTDALWDLALTQTPDEPARGALIALESIQRLGGANVKNDPKHAKALAGIVDRTRGTAKFVLLVDRFNLNERHGDLLTLAQANVQAQLGVDAVRVLLNKRENGLLASALAADTPAALVTLTVLGTAADERANPLLLPIVNDTKRPLDVRREAARALARNHAGGLALLKMAKDGQLDERLKITVAVPLTTAIWPDVHKEAARVFPLPNAGNQKALPAIGALLKERGDAQRGRQVFTTRGTCINCHQVGTEGKQTGPNLTEIGDKLALPAMFESILYPSAGISVGYETYELTTAEGTVVIGLLADKTADTIRIKNVEGIVLSYPAKGAELRKLDTSLMPADLQKNMTQQDLVDLVAYLRTLKKGKEVMTTGK
ncbi:MAG: c-type cytochrome, partial [Planctomycetia bacterium]|nr:c-type cytochrome [Planctomycetia bacterium]